MIYVCDQCGLPLREGRSAIRIFHDEQAQRFIVEPQYINGHLIQGYLACSARCASEMHVRLLHAHFPKYFRRAPAFKDNRRERCLRDAWMTTVANLTNPLRDR